MIFRLLFFVVFLVALVLAVRALRSRPTEPDSPGAVGFDRRPPFTRAERSFLGVLDGAVGGSARVFAKVRLADLVKVRAGLSRSESTTANNKIRMKHVDFVLCAPDDLRVLAVVELDDESHAGASRRVRDAFVDDALSSAGIPIHRFRAKAAYTVHEVRAALGDLARPSSEPAALEPGSPPRALAAIGAGTAATPGLDGTEAPRAEGTCPRCGNALVERTVKRGARKGTTFLACSGFPGCRYSASV